MDETVIELNFCLGITLITISYTGANTEEQSAAELCKNPLVTSATKTPYGVICMIPREVKTDSIQKRQHFVRSLPKELRSEQNANLGSKVIPIFKPIRQPFSAETNGLTKRSIFSNWFQKFYESVYKSYYNSLKNLIFRHMNGQSEGQGQPNGHPMQGQLQIGQHFRPQLNNPLPEPNNQLLNTQESQMFSHFNPSMIQKTPNFEPQNIAPDFAHNMIHSTPDINQDISQDYIPLQQHINDDLALNDPVIDETRLGEAVLDMPHYNYGSVRQLATYLQSIQEKINRQKDSSEKDVNESSGSEFVPHLRGINDNHDDEDKHDVVIPLYTDVKVRENVFEHSDSEASDEVRHVVNKNPRKLVYEFHGYKKDIDCNGRFKPLKSELEKEHPVPKVRRKRYIELDYSQMQLRKLPVWFKRNEENTVPEAIVEVKPRSLFRWEQPMMGWRPLVPPELMRKDLFLKRNGDPLKNWDHEQVESQAHYLWHNTDDNENNNNTETEPKTAESFTIESLKNLDLTKTSVIIDRRGYAGRDLHSISKSQDIGDKQTDDKYETEELVFKRRPDSQIDMSYDNQVITSTEPQKEIISGIKAVEVENVGEDVTKAKSLEDIAAIPGAVIKPIDPQLTDILLKVLSHNSEFSRKRITNAYFLEFPKPQEYRPPMGPLPMGLPPIGPPPMGLPPIGPPPGSVAMYHETPVQMGVETIMNANYNLHYDKDIRVTDADYEYGEIVCTNKVTGAVADVRKGCQIYFQCTQYTIDTYVCPRGTRFDDRRQQCLPSNEVLCG